MFLFYIYVFAAVTVTLCYCCSSFLTKTQKICKNRNIKGTLSCLKQFLATEAPLEMMKNVFYFTSKALFVPKIFKFLS